MAIVICDAAKLTDLSSLCVRENWASIVPLVLVLVFLVTTAPFPGPVRYMLGRFKQPFKNFLPLSEALALGEDEGEDGAEAQTKPPVPVWRTAVLSTLALSEMLAWLGVGVYRAVTDAGDVFYFLRPFLLAATWSYASLRSMAYPTATPPYGSFTLFVTHLVFSVLTFGGVLYDHQVVGLPLPDTLNLVALTLNLVVILALLVVVLSMPLAVPDYRAKKIDVTVCPID